MIPGFIVVLLAAILDWLAVARNWKKVEYAAKPGTMLLLLGLLGLVSGIGSAPLVFFGLGILFSLAGDVFLMFSDRWFIPGLVSFLLAHLAYIAGLNLPLSHVALAWPLGLVALLILVVAVEVLRRIVAALKRKGHSGLVGPVVIYGVVISVMLFSANLALFRPAWKALPAALVSVGAFLFYLSDVVLAWNKFVSPIRNGRVVNMILYHLGQFALIAGVMLQFAT
jgi:uncharacterized membrane protein YhhN